VQVLCADSGAFGTEQRPAQQLCYPLAQARVAVCRGQGGATNEEEIWHHLCRKGTSAPSDPRPHGNSLLLALLHSIRVVCDGTV